MKYLITTKFVIQKFGKYEHRQLTKDEALELLKKHHHEIQASADATDNIRQELMRLIDGYINRSPNNADHQTLSLGDGESLMVVLQNQTGNTGPGMGGFGQPAHLHQPNVEFIDRLSFSIITYHHPAPPHQP